jgi:hypothetical protein
LVTLVSVHKLLLYYLFSIIYEVLKHILNWQYDCITLENEPNQAPEHVNIELVETGDIGGDYDDSKLQLTLLTIYAVLLSIMTLYFKK